MSFSEKVQAQQFLPVKGIVNARDVRRLSRRVRFWGGKE